MSEGFELTEMAATQGAAALSAALAAVVATLWWCGSGNWSLSNPQRKEALASVRISPWQWAMRRWSSITACGAATVSAGCVRAGLVGLIGNTPLIRIESLSNATGCEVCPEPCLFLRLA